MIPITVTEIPTTSALRGSLARASFWDAYEAPLRNGALSPTEIALKSFGATPLWVSWLMALRNGLVRLVGLKSVGALAVGSDKPASAYRVGDRLGIFTIQAMSDAEILMGIDDRHLDVRVSIVKPEAGETPRYVVSTVVRVHNALGRLYMLPVGRIHPLIVRAMMRRAVV